MYVVLMGACLSVGTDYRGWLKITTFNNNTYPTKANAPSWSVTWTYPQGAETQPVHAYPNVEIGKPDLPTQLKDISRIYFDVEWTYNVGNDTTYFTNISALTAAEINANVAIDLFMDRNKKNSADSSKATYEIMIWFAVLGSAAEPIGFKEGEIVNRTINGTLLSVCFLTHAHACEICLDLLLMNAVTALSITARIRKTRKY